MSRGGSSPSTKPKAHRRHAYQSLRYRIPCWDPVRAYRKLTKKSPLHPPLLPKRRRHTITTTTDDSQRPRAATRLPELLALALPVPACRRDSDEKVADWSSALARECASAVRPCFAGSLGDEAKVVPKSAQIYVDLNVFLDLNVSFRRSQPFELHRCRPREPAREETGRAIARLMGPARGVFVALHSVSAGASFKVDGEEGDQSIMWIKLILFLPFFLLAQKCDTPWNGMGRLGTYTEPSSGFRVCPTLPPLLKRRLGCDRHPLPLAVLPSALLSIAILALLASPTPDPRRLSPTAGLTIATWGNLASGVVGAPRGVQTTPSPSLCARGPAGVLPPRRGHMQQIAPRARAEVEDKRADKGQGDEGGTEYGMWREGREVGAGGGCSIKGTFKWEHDYFRKRSHHWVYVGERRWSSNASAPNPHYRALKRNYSTHPILGAEFPLWTALSQLLQFFRRVFGGQMTSSQCHSDRNSHSIDPTKVVTKAQFDAAVVTAFQITSGRVETPAEDIQILVKLLGVSEETLGGIVAGFPKGEEVCRHCGRAFSFLDIAETGLQTHSKDFLVDVMTGKYGYIVNPASQAFNCHTCGKKCDGPGIYAFAPCGRGGYYAAVDTAVQNWQAPITHSDGMSERIYLPYTSGGWPRNGPAWFLDTLVTRRYAAMPRQLGTGRGEPPNLDPYFKSATCVRGEVHGGATSSIRHRFGS
ncbi:hypothetical protein B0H11DRAFT_2184805 [Mycena galericulata]|nr:hypothetical protein B0H11DRAFT_2184805 [Mycena galericulata]